jgi:uncharacterized protein YndB with AHSA1/START domain
MAFKTISRRDFSITVASAVPLLTIAGPRALRPAADEITHTSDAIHQEVLFKAPRKRVYEALTDAAQFEKVVQLSNAVKTGMVPPGKPAEISRDPGGAFALFGGYISGRQIELVPNERIVQAWRTGSWPAGAFSIAQFALTDQDSNTKLIFDHRGFPDGTAQHLAEGWHVNYWEPLAKFLS